MPILIRIFRRIQRTFKSLKAQKVEETGVNTQNIIPQYEDSFNKGKSTCGHILGGKLDELPKSTKKGLTSILMFLRCNNRKLTDKLWEYVKNEVLFEKVDATRVL